MGKDPEIWENPEEFRPERFDVVKSSDKFNFYNYVPFSAGQRNCIGQKFAMLEMKSTISKVLRNYEISTPKDFEPIDILEIITKSKNGLQLLIKDRIY
jgi:cytochrome P450 family 4